jgi:hypothetical protein
MRKADSHFANPLDCGFFFFFLSDIYFLLFLLSFRNGIFNFTFFLIKKIKIKPKYSGQTLRNKNNVREV